MDTAPIPEGENLEFELSLREGKFTLRYFTSGRWQALRYGEDWPACPYPSWRSESNMATAAYFELAAIRQNWGK